MNRHQQISLDPLDLPIFHDAETVQYHDIVSKFHVFLPSIPLENDPSNVIPTVIQNRNRSTQNTEILVDPTYNPGDEGSAQGGTVHPVPGQTPPNNTQLDLRRSTRARRPTWKYRERDTDSYEDP